MSVWSDKQQVTHYPVCVCVINSVRRLIQRIQMGITLKRETIMAWDALPIRIKLHTPAQHALISKNRNTGRLLCLVNVAVVSVTKYGSSSCLGQRTDALDHVTIMTIHLAAHCVCTFVSNSQDSAGEHTHTVIKSDAAAVTSRMPAAPPLSGMTYRCTIVQVSSIHAELLPSRIGIPVAYSYKDAS